MRRTLLSTALVTVLFAGCFAVTSTPTDIDASLEPSGWIDPLNVGGYLHNVTEKAPGVTVLNSLLQHVRIAASDGIMLDAYIVRPRAEGKYPLVLEVTPYYGGGSPLTGHCPGTVPVAGSSVTHCFAPWGDELVPRGYAVGIASVRGTGNSEGCFTQGGPSEAKDTAAVIEHFAKQPWSNGRVGLMGVSYPGTTPQDVWVEAPPSLKTIIPISGISDLYKYNFANGIPLNVQGFGFNTYYWAIVGLGPAGLEGGAQALDPASLPGAIRGEACTDQVDVQEGGVSST
ncbi:MAG TPA: CocE/NonD family hydrolase, partial [Candidatus Thermoplasmatota archaeon]|nr:CocE/NonD family hydrolase [Candidatus Thermoplasmatota archaeon]